MTWFKNCKTLTKLMMAFGLLSLLLGVVGYMGISAASNIEEMLQTLYARDLTGLSAVKDVRVDVIRISRDLSSVVLATDAAQVQRLTTKIDSEFKSLDTSIAEAEGTLTSEDAKTSMAKIKELRPQYEAVTREILRLSNDKRQAAEKLDAMTIDDQINELVKNVVAEKEKLGKRAYDESGAKYVAVRNTLVIAIVIGVVLSAAIGLIIARLISAPLAATVNVLDKVAAGDLTVTLEVETRDEVGQMAQSLNRTIEGMRQALTEVRNSAESMASSSQQLASASEELSSGAQQQASSLEETTATLEEITSTVKQNADNAKQASQVASGSRDTAQKGGQVVAEAVSAMGEINEASKNIAEIITTIDEIAFQTNLLALNAAVEAARAGEQGRGFAVVATEVRNLAQRSATSAKEIKRLIQDSVRKVDNGSELVNKSGETLHQIIDSVKRVTDIVAEIAAASREQSTGIEQVNKAMVQMDQVTQTNSSQTEELSSTAQNLASHAEQLQALVQRFRVDNNGSRQSRSALHASAAARPRIAVRKTAPTPPKNTASSSEPCSKTTLDSPVMTAVPASIKPNGHDNSDGGAFVDF